MAYTEIPVASSMLSAIGYDDEKMLITVVFPKGAAYVYPGAKALFNKFAAYPSKGQFFLAHIKPLGGVKK